MSDASEANNNGDKNVSQTTRPSSLAIADAGIKTGSAFAGLMSAVMRDLIAGDMTPQVGNAVCKAGQNLLKIVEMQHKYGKAAQTGDNGEKVLKLTP